MDESTAPPRRRMSRAGRIVAVAAGAVLVGAGVTVGVVSANAEPVRAQPTPPIDHDRPVATAEQAYALSLPVLEHGLDADITTAWIVVSNTLEHASRALVVSSVDQAEYARWVPRFEGIVAVAEAASAGDRVAAGAAAALSETVLAAQVDLPAGVAGQALTEALPALRAVDAVQDAVLHAHAADAATAAADLDGALADFRDWHRGQAG